MKINKEILLIIMAMALLSVLIGIWINAVYDKEVNNLQTQTNIEFLHALDETEKKLIFRKAPSGFIKEIDESIPRNHSHDSIHFQKMMVVKIKQDSSSYERFDIKELINSAGLNNDSNANVTISINTNSSEFTLDGKETFSIDADSAIVTLSKLFSDRLSTSSLSGLRYKVIENGMDSNFQASFITDAGSVGNVFFDTGEFIAAIDLSPIVILRRMVPELLFALLLFLAVAGAFLFIYRSLNQERRLAELKDDFISNITHELKTPISIVNVAVEALSNFDVLQDSKKSNEYLDISRKELVRLDGLVDKMLNSAQDSSSTDSNKERIEINKTILKVVRSMKVQQSKINVKIKDEDVMILMNLENFKSVIYSLIDNAIKYGPEKEPIDVEVKTSDNEVRISVIDHGDGIPLAHQKYIFDKFHRVPTSNIHNVKGHGLGLYHAKKHIQDAGGSVKVKCQKDKCSFLIRLPIAHVS